MSNSQDDDFLDAKDFTKVFPRFLVKERIGSFRLPDIDLDLQDQKNLKKHFDELCLHEWVEYKGFREDYPFCKKCDKKKL